MHEQANMRLVLSEEAISARIRELGREISADFHNKRPVVIGILKGAFIFLADLVRQLSVSVEVDFIRVSSYGAATRTSGCCTISKHADIVLAGRDVLLVEDIVDTGNTLDFLRQVLATSGAESVRACVFIDKGERRERQVAVDYAAFRVARGFLVGYGLDSAEQYRHLPAVYALADEKRP